MSGSQGQSASPLLAGGARRFIVGQDVSGHWLAVDAARSGGGYFKSRADAVHFAAFETGHRPGGVAFASTPLRLFA